MKIGLVKHEALARDIFIALLDRWDVKDKASAEVLARASVQIADGFVEVAQEAFDSKLSSKKVS